MDSEFTLVKEGISILKELGDKNEFSELVKIIEETPNKLYGMKVDERKEFISSFK